MTRRAALLLACAGAARAGEGREVLVNARGATILRGGDGYASHAAAFGFGDIDRAHGYAVEAGVGLLPRLAIVGSWTQAWSESDRDDDAQSTLSVQTRAALAHLRLAAWQRDLTVYGGPKVLARAQASLGGGWTWIRDRLDGVGRTSIGPGVRAGVDAVLYWEGIGILAGYAYQWSAASVHDRIGGTITAGGHEISLGVAFRL